MDELPDRMRSLPRKTFKNELHNLLLSVLEQCDDYLDTDQITFALKSDHMKRWLRACPHTAFYCWDLEKNEQNLTEKLPKVKSNFYFFKKERKHCSRGIVHS